MPQLHLQHVQKPRYMTLDMKCHKHRPLSEGAARQNGGLAEQAMTCVLFTSQTDKVKILQQCVLGVCRDHICKP